MSMLRKRSGDVIVPLLVNVGENEKLLLQTPDRVEKLPDPEDEYEVEAEWDFKAFLTVAGSTANLMATSMGTGMLALPIAVYYSGAVTGTVLIIAMAILSDMSLIFLVKAARQSGTSSLQELGRYYFGPQGELLVNVSLVALLICASLSILIAISELVTPLWREALNGSQKDDHWWLESWFVMLFCIVLIYPISIPSNLKPLSYSSAGAVCSVVLVFIFMMIRFCSRGVTKTSPVHLFVDSPLVSLALPIQGLAYCSQFNVIGIYLELKEHKRHIESVIHASVGITCIIYGLFGLVGYLYFGEETGKYSMILDGFHHDKLMLVAAAMISLTNILKFPLIILPFRNTVNHILFGKDDYGIGVNALETILILVVIYILARVVGDLALGLELSGPTVGVFICFILPSLLYFQSEKERMTKSMPQLQRSERTIYSRNQITAMIVAFMGAVMGIATIAGLVYQNS